MRRALALGCLGLTASSAAQAADVSVTPFGGYRWGGTLTEITRRVDISLRSSGSFGIAVDVGIAGDRRLELRFSRQPTELKATGLGTDERFLDVNVDTLHLGGIKTWSGDDFHPFVVISAGTTSFRPGNPQVEGDTRFSVGFGGGTQLVLSSVAAIRVEGRLFSVFTSRGANVLCIGENCQIGYGGRNIMFQGEVAAGLTLSF